MFLLFFFFNDPATPEIYTLSLHDALPISSRSRRRRRRRSRTVCPCSFRSRSSRTPCRLQWCFVGVELLDPGTRSEEHTSELQSHSDLVCRLLLEKKKKKKIYNSHNLNSQQ